MTEKERFQRAFTPLHASPDTMTEVMKMTERKMKRPALRRAATIGLAAALVLALGSVAYASDLGGIQRTVQLWIKGDQTDAVMTIDQALDGEQKKVPLEEAAEAVSGDYVYLYPPGIPILVPGEMIDAATVETVRDCIRLGLEVEGLPDLTCIDVVK